MRDKAQVLANIADPKAQVLDARAQGGLGAYERELALTSPMTIFMFLPLAHALARMVQMVSLDVGGTLAYWRGDARLLLEDLAEARPTHVPSVPQVATSAVGQVASERGLRPAGTNEQVPIMPWTLQALQVSSQAVSQQTPSTQKPD